MFIVKLTKSTTQNNRKPGKPETGRSDNWKTEKTSVFELKNKYSGRRLMGSLWDPDKLIQLTE